MGAKESDIRNAPFDMSIGKQAAAFSEGWAEGVGLRTDTWYAGASRSAGEARSDTSNEDDVGALRTSVTPVTRPSKASPWPCRPSRGT
jgi:hypothetical protein